MFKYLKNDIPSSVVVFLVALPLCLGVALASGAPLFSGIIAGMCGGIVVSLISGSKLSVSGPAAGLTAIVFAAIASVGDYSQFLVAVMLAGVFQLILGVVRAGGVANYIPSNVIKAMLAAIGIILIIKQIPHAIGYDGDYEGDFAFLQSDNENSFTTILKALNKIDSGATIIALISLAIIALWGSKYGKKLKFVPAPLVVVLASLGLNQLFGMIDQTYTLRTEHLVKLPISNSISDFFGQFTLPNFEGLYNQKVYIAAITIAIVASIESLLSLEAVDNLDPEKRVSPTNRELIAQGFGNISSGLLGGIPVTSVIVRSSANVDSGAKSQFSAFMHGIWLFLAVLLMPKIMNLIPLSALAAILLATGYKLAKVSIFKQMWKDGYMQFIPFFITILAIVFTDLLKGIAIGMLISVLFLLSSSLRKSFLTFIKNTKKAYTHKIVDTPDGEAIKIEFKEEVSFLNKADLNQFLDEIPEKSTVILDGRKTNYIDHDILEIINDFVKTKSVNRHLQLSFIGFHPKFNFSNN